MVSKDYLIYSIPFISALIGWLTNYIAVKMIFRPRKKINILGIKIQGLIPKRQEQLADKIADVVETHLVSIEDIKQISSEPELHQKLINNLHKKLNIFLKDTLIKINPMIMSFISEELLEKINSLLAEKISEMLPELIDEFIKHLETKLNFKELVKEKIKNFDVLKLEEIILKISATELKAIEIFGGVLGFFIGLIQILLLKM